MKKNDKDIYVSDGTIAYNSEIQKALEYSSIVKGILVFRLMIYKLNAVGLQVHSNTILYMQSAVFIVDKNSQTDGCIFLEKVLTRYRLWVVNSAGEMIQGNRT